MTVGKFERRRTPRVAVQECSIDVTSRCEARVLEIGLDGVLMASDALPRSTGLLRLTLKGTEFVARLRVCHTVTSTDGATLAGAGFTGVSAESHRVLERFLLQATPAKDRVQES